MPLPSPHSLLPHLCHLNFRAGVDPEIFLRGGGGGGGAKGRKGCIILMLCAWVTNSGEGCGVKPEPLYTVTLHMFVASARHTSAANILYWRGGGRVYCCIGGIHVPERETIHCPHKSQLASPPPLTYAYCHATTLFLFLQQIIFPTVCDA